ncbi:MAG: hypothetical protein AB8B97_00920 [Granulosicoccus sp.]
MAKLRKAQCAVPVATAIVGVLASFTTSVQAGGYTFDQLPDSVTHPEGYDGTGGELTLNVCIVPGTPFASEMERPLRNNIAVWNKLQSTSANLRQIPLPSNTYDFESVSLHEFGHCLGIDHPNIGTGFGLQKRQENFSAATPGANGVFDLNEGPDGLIGSADDIRGDDINRNFFYADSNNPFVEQEVVDSSNYRRELADLPFGDTFPANADREVSATGRFAIPNTEAVMQQGTFNDEIQRTLGHDDVSTLRYARSGFDAIQGTDDDYTVKLTYGGITEGEDCNITVEMDVTKTGFAACDLAGFYADNTNIVISRAQIYFDPNDDWYFNNTPPCTESMELTPDVWEMISLPCQVGISTSATVGDVLGDDLGQSTIGTTWAIYSYEYTESDNGLSEGAYRALTLTDELDSSKAYWIIATDSGATIDVTGEYNAQLDTALYIDTASGEFSGWNLVGMPYRYPVTWADAVAVDPFGNRQNLFQADPPTGDGGTACFPGGSPTPDCKVGQVGFRYDGELGDYERLDTTTGAVGKFSAAWVLAGDEGYKLRFPIPSAELLTP